MKTYSISSVVRIATLFSFSGVAMLSPVNAQEQKASNRLLEEVVVTAQKREERIEDVPISLQVFSQEKMEALGITSVQDIQLATPGFTVTSASGFNITFLRGVGSDAFLPGVDTSVPFYLDGIPLLTIMGTSDSLGRVDRVEVLKGPQGTLFGRNATGGAISIVTPRPEQELFGDIKVEVGNYNMANATAFVNFPVSDSIAVNATLFTNNRDNHITNSSTGSIPEMYAHGARTKVRWDIYDEFALTINGTYQRTSGNCSLGFQNVRPAPFLALVNGPADPEFDREVSLDSDYGCQNESYAWGGTLDWAAEYLDSKLIFARQKVQTIQVDGPFDGTTAHLADAQGGGRNGSNQYVRQDTAELQFLSNANTPYSEYLEWATGFFYLKSIGGLDPITFGLAPDLLGAISPDLSNVLSQPLNDILGLINLPPLLSDQGVLLANSGLLKSESFSFYAQPTIHVSESVDLTLGARYQQEKRDLEKSATFIFLNDGSKLYLPLPQGGEEQLTPEQVSARVALQWRPFEGNDTQFYVSWARGWKNPTYNTVNLVGDLFGTMVPLKEERVDTSELGIKSALFDNALKLNTAIFYTEQKDPLSSNVSLLSGGIANFTNAGSAKITGIDGDFLLSPLPNINPGLVITGAFSYLEAIYTEYTDGRGYDKETGISFGNGGAGGPPRDFSGNQIPRVPRWSYQFGINQRIDLNADHTIELGADMFYSSEIYFLPQNDDLARRDDLYLFNARASYFYNPAGLEIGAFINNIEDTNYVESAFVTEFGTSLTANDNPRIYGIRAKYTF